MSEESTTPDLVALARASIEAANRGDVDAVLGFWGPDPVWDMSPMGLGVYEGRAAVRGFIDDWLGAYEEYEMQAEEVVDHGSGVTGCLITQKGRPVGSSGEVRLRYASVNTWEDGKLVRTTNYRDIDEGRAAAEHLAEERG